MSPDPKLTPTEIQALVVLMAEARELTNNELKELGGFTLTGASNKKLEVTLGLVATDRSHRPYSHQLTDKGRRLVRSLHTGEPPKAGGSAGRTLFTLLANLSRSLDRLQIGHDDFFKQGPLPDLETRIRNAYRGLVDRPGDWVGLADLRDAVGEEDRAAVDGALRTLLRQPGVRIIPVANTKSLKERDRAAALRIGDEDSHTIAIGQS